MGGKRGIDKDEGFCLKRLLVEEEAKGYDVPFVTFTWQGWIELQAQTTQNYSRFLRAIENRRIDIAPLVGLEMAEMSIDLLKEACSWVGTTGIVKPGGE